MRLASRLTLGLVLLLPLAGCGGDAPTNTEPGDLDFSVDFYNHDASNPTHLFSSSETFPCCRVNPNEHRTIQFTGMKVGNTITFGVGRNGQMLKTITCTVKTDDPNAARLVDWTHNLVSNPTGTLKCGLVW